MSTGGARQAMLEPAISLTKAPWSHLRLPDCAIPGMITEEEKRYYVWVGSYFSGIGGAAELGPWLGCSTYYIVAGLRATPPFVGRRLAVFDDFVWRSSWMDRHYAEEDRPANGADFLGLFESYTSEIADFGAPVRCQISPTYENRSLPGLSWTQGPVELLYVDCGRTFEVNEAWWNVFEPSFIPGHTLIVMQDWQLYKRPSASPWDQTKEFTDSKGTALTLVHELAFGNIGTFLYDTRNRSADG